MQNIMKPLRREKVKVGMHNFIPRTINFSEMEKPDAQEEGYPYDADDEGLQMEQVETTLQFEEMIIQMLYNLEGRERFIFLYQLLRDFGYQIDHTSFAKTLRLKRQTYMRILKTVRTKTFLIVHGYKNSANKPIGNGIS